MISPYAESVYLINLNKPNPPRWTFPMVKENTIDKRVFYDHGIDVKLFPSVCYFT
jgi:hypothetical protein